MEESKIYQQKELKVIGFNRFIGRKEEKKRRNLQFNNFMMEKKLKDYGESKQGYQGPCERI